MQVDCLGHWIHQGLLLAIELLQGHIQQRSQALVYIRPRTGIGPLGETFVTQNDPVSSESC